MYNIYKLSYDIQRKLLLGRAKYIEETRVACSKEQHAKDFRSIHLDFGRRTGKSEFAVDMLAKDITGILVVTFSYSMAMELNEKLYLRERELDKRGQLSHPIICATSLPACLENIGSKLDKRLKSPELHTVIIDEPGFIKPKYLDYLYEICNDNVTFIHLGRPRK